MGKIKIRVVSKAKNSVLAELADKYGSIRTAAGVIGVTAATYSRWLNFHGSFKPMKNSGVKKIQNIALALERETGVSVKSIFPLNKDQLSILHKPRIEEHEIDTLQLEDYRVYKEQRMIEQEVDTDRISDNMDLKEIFTRHLKELSYREREILRMRFEAQRTLQETADLLGVSKERIRQLEGRALVKLRFLAEKELEPFLLEKEKQV